MKIEQIPAEDLIPYAKNAKLHSAAQVSSIAGSIKEFGFNNPVLIDKDNGIIAGHGRVLAAQKLKMKAIPCVRLGHLTENQKRAYIIADNRLAERAEWDMEMLKMEIESIDFGDFKDFNLDDLGEFEFPEVRTGSDDIGDKDTQEIDVDGIQCAKRCPRCGFEFDKEV